MWDEDVVEVQHPEKPTKLVGRFRCWKVSESADLFWKWPGAMLIHSMAKDVDAVGAEDALGPLDDNAVFGEAFEEHAEVGFILLLIFACDEDVVEVDEDVLEALSDPIHEALESLSGALQSERHPDKLPQAERRDDRRLGDVSRRHRDLHVSPHQVDFGEDPFPGEAGVEVPHCWDGVSIVFGCAV